MVSGVREVVINVGTYTPNPAEKHILNGHH